MIIVVTNLYGQRSLYQSCIYLSVPEVKHQTPHRVDVFFQSEIREIRGNSVPANFFCLGGELYVLIKHDVPLKTGSFLPNIHSFCSWSGVKFLHFRRHLFWLTIFDIIWLMFLQMGWNHHLAMSFFFKLSMFKCWTCKPQWVGQHGPAA